MPLALYTFGLFIHPAEAAENDGFYTLNDPIFDEVDVAPGLIARSGYASDAGGQSWGPEVYPPFYTEKGDGWSPATLSLWDSLEAILAFTYSGLHQVAVERGSEWFQKGDWPPLVLWWHDQHDRPPTWSEGVERFMMLHDNGPSPAAFDFKTSFDAAGQPLRADPQRIKSLKRDPA